MSKQRIKKRGRYFELKKIEKLHAFGRARQMTKMKGFKNLCDFHRDADGRGAYECDWVSPYSISACNVDAEVMVVLQDWASVEDLKKPVDADVQRLGYTPSSATNVNLQKLLLEHFRLELKDIFATNLFPFIKPGKMNSSIPAEHMRQAACVFCEPQIQIVKPKLVICMGVQVFNVLRRFHGLRDVDTVDQGVNAPFCSDGIRYWCQSHPGSQGRNIRNGGGRAGQVGKDWKAMANEFFGADDIKQNECKAVEEPTKSKSAERSSPGRAKTRRTPSAK